MAPDQKPSSASSSDTLALLIKQLNESYMQTYNNLAAAKSQITSRNLKPLDTFNFPNPSLVDADSNRQIVRDVKEKKKNRVVEDVPPTQQTYFDASTPSHCRQTVRDVKKKKKNKVVKDVSPTQQTYFDASTPSHCRQTVRDVKKKKKNKVVEDVSPTQQTYFNALNQASFSNAYSKLPKASIYGFGSLSPGISGLVPRTKSNLANTGNATPVAAKSVKGVDDSTKKVVDMLRGPDGELPQKLRNIPHHLIETVSNEIMENDLNVCWDDIAGLHHAKKCVTEMVVWPLIRPDVFKGCRSPGRGLLLFGPPGTGKTMMGKAIAGEAKATFFYISASSLTSKWVGEGEKLVRALFGVACCRQPAVIFVDEIDSLLSQRKSDREQESSRRLKTQFFIEMEGFDSGNEQVLLIGATNRPQDLDEAARRRLTKRLYIPLPSAEARASIVQNILEKDGLFKLATEDVDTICKLTEGYSGSDMKNLVKDASMGPLREAVRLGTTITNLKVEDMRRVALQDFKDALQEVRPSVSRAELGIYEEWNNQFGSLPPSSKNCDLSQSCSTGSYDMLHGPDGKLPQKLQNIPQHLIETICNEIMDGDPNVRWDDIAGLHQAKKCATEMAILPLLHPDIFKGCRSPGRGLLLFGPPGTGKTMIGKAIAGEAKATFFYISASSLTSKWTGESEKLVRALFGVASCRQPAVIFVDEIDSMLSQRRSNGEHELYRRMKTQFFIEMEGFDSVNDQILLIGATNRPQELDEAARRRLTKRLYIPLPSSEARALIVRNLLEKDGLFNLSTEDVDTICELTEGYSGSDMRNVVKDAAMGPVREALKQCAEGSKLKKEDMRPITLQDFEDALKEVRPSVSLDQIGIYEDWNNQFGSLLPSKTCDSIQCHHPRKKLKTSAMGEYNASSHAQTGNSLVDEVNEIPCPMDHTVAKRVGKAKVIEQTNGQVNGTYDNDIEIILLESD